MIRIRCMLANRGCRLASALLLVLGAPTLASAQVYPLAASSAMAQVVAHGDRFVRAAADQESVQFVLALPLKDSAGLEKKLHELYDPKNPSFRHFMTAAEFDAKYAPSAAEYSVLKAFARSSGLNVVRELPGHTLLGVSGDVASIRRLFGVQMNWRQTSEGALYFAGDREPASPSALAALGGHAAMLNQKPPRPLIRRASVTPKPNAGTGPTGSTRGDTPSYVPSDIKTAYNLNSIQNGGTPVALFELSTANYADAQVYATAYGLNNPIPTSSESTWLKNVDGGTTDTSGSLEVMLDVDMVMAVSNPTSLYIYSAPLSGWLDEYKQIAEDNLVGQVSSSWTNGCEAEVGASTMAQENAVFQQMAAQGMAVFIAAGDQGSYPENEGGYGCDGSGVQVTDPASQPYVTSAGGTSLTTSTSQAYVSETVWNDLSTGFGATGGGVSANWTIPWYQSGLTTSDTEFSTTMRNTPDMSLNADPYTGYYIYSSDDGGWNPNIGGTSAVAPQLASFWSLVSKTLGSRAGFANPVIYTIGRNSTLYASAFHDVTVGNNGCAPNGNQACDYDAFAGYDNATGLGSYNGANLYNSVLGIKRAAFLGPVIELLLQ